MSAQLAPTGLTQPASRPALQAVAPPQPRKLAGLPFAFLCVMILALGLGGMIVLNTTIQEHSRQLGQLEREAKQLYYREAMLVTEVDTLRSPNNLAAQALRIGMVPNANAAFIILPEGEIRGNTSPVKGREVVGVVVGGREVKRSMEPAPLPKNQASPSAQPSTQPSTQPNVQASTQPSAQPSAQASTQPSAQASSQPSAQPSQKPSQKPSAPASAQPSQASGGQG